MSDISIINLNAVSIYLMEIDLSRFESYCSSLNEQEKVKLEHTHHPRKKLEYAASRYLKHQLFGARHIEYDSTGGPRIEGIGFLSLSHSDSYVGIAISTEHLVGLDIEEIRQKAVTLSPKFITPEEALLFDQESALEMSALWSLKECLYKLSDRKELIFKQDILVTKRENRTFGSIKKSTGIYEYELHVENFRNILITCNLGNGKLLHGYPQ